MSVIVGTQPTNFPYAGNDSVPRMYATDMYGRVWFEITQADMGAATQKWGEPEDFSFSTSPLSEHHYIPLKTRNFEIRVDMPDQDQPLWGEPVSAQGSASNLTFQVDGLLSKIGDRFIDRTSEIFTSVPQAQIMKRLIEYAQDESRTKFRKLNLTPRIVDLGTVSGIPRSRKYFREEHANILDSLYEFRNTTTPIVLNMTYQPINPLATHSLWRRYIDIIPVYDIIYPLSTPLVFSTQRVVSNILDFSYSEDATDLITDAYVTGGSSGNIRFEGHYMDQTAASVHGNRQGIISVGDMTDPDWLESQARAEVEHRKRPIQTITLTTVSVPSPVARFAWVGTIWPVRIDCGRIQVDGNFRILSRTYNPDRTVVLTLEQMMKPIPKPKDALLLWPGS